MSYKISGTKSETSRIIILKESDWSIESNTVVSGSGDYSVEDLETGSKLAFSRATDGEIVGYGTVSAIQYGPPEGSLWTYGDNNVGELGLGDQINRSSPTQVGALTDWIEVDTYGDGLMALKVDGTIWSCGSNAYGQLGQGDITHRSSPVQIGSDTNWNFISAGNAYAAIKTDGTLWTWGYNSLGLLGQGDVIKRSSPTQVGSLTTWNDVCVGWGSSMSAVKTDGSLWIWGTNAQAQLGLGDTDPRSSPTQVGVLTDWDNATFGGWHGHAVKTDGTLWGWGWNNNGQLGLGHTVNDNSSPVQVGALTDWSKVYGGYAHTYALKTDGTLWAWGRNEYGELADGTVTWSSSPTQVGVFEDWTHLASGYRTGMGIRNGTLWSWGRNNDGQLGLGDQTSRSSPTQVGALTDWVYTTGKGAIKT
jgi:alpha-tubulin suppressor-like RCC1 family protein